MKIQSAPSLVFIFVLGLSLSAQEKNRFDETNSGPTPSPWRLLNVDTKASLRGLHVLSESCVWASGTGGTIISTVDGKTWKVQIVPGAEKLDFRDIHAIDEKTIVAMTSGAPACIYRSTDGGSSWQRCYENADEKVFLDDLSFIDNQRGIVMGDSIDGTLFLLQTIDGGKTWSRIENTPQTLAGEAGFAASGSNMAVFGKQKIAIALGSAEPDQAQPTCRVLLSENLTDWSASRVPLRRTPSAGIFSICFANVNDGVVVGGDYQKPDEISDNFAVTRDSGQTWTVPQPRQPPSGFRSCVATWRDGQEICFVTVGTNGTDLSTDLGLTWRRVSDEGFHAVEFTPDGRHGWATGGDGRVAKWLGISPTTRTP